MEQYAMHVTGADGDQPNYGVHCHVPTEFQWRRPDGIVIKSQIAAPSIGSGVVWALLYGYPPASGPVAPPYDMWMREQGGEWQRVCEVVPGPNGTIDVNRVDHQASGTPSGGQYAAT